MEACRNTLKIHRRTKDPNYGGSKKLPSFSKSILYIKLTLFNEVSNKRFIIFIKICKPNLLNKSF